MVSALTVYVIAVLPVDGVTRLSGILLVQRIWVYITTHQVAWYPVSTTVSFSPHSPITAVKREDAAIESGIWHYIGSESQQEGEQVTSFVPYGRPLNLWRKNDPYGLQNRTCHFWIQTKEQNIESAPFRIPWGHCIPGARGSWRNPQEQTVKAACSLPISLNWLTFSKELLTQGGLSTYNNPVGY